MTIGGVLRDRTRSAFAAVEKNTLSILVKWRPAKHPFSAEIEKNLSFEPKEEGWQEITKEVAGIHFFLTRSLFDDGIPRRFLLRVYVVKPISALLRF